MDKLIYGIDYANGLDYKAEVRGYIINGVLKIISCKVEKLNNKNMRR